MTGAGVPCWDVALTAQRRRGVPQWVTVRAQHERDAQVAAVMWGMQQDPAVAWTPGRVRVSRATAHAQQQAPHYGSDLVHRLCVAIREGRIHVAGFLGMLHGDSTEGTAAAWYAMGPEP